MVRLDLLCHLYRPMQSRTAGYARLGPCSPSFGGRSVRWRRPAARRCALMPSKAAKHGWASTVGIKSNNRTNSILAEAVALEASCILVRDQPGEGGASGGEPGAEVRCKHHTRRVYENDPPYRNVTISPTDARIFRRSSSLASYGMFPTKMCTGTESMMRCGSATHEWITRGRAAHAYRRYSCHSCS